MMGAWWASLGEPVQQPWREIVQLRERFQETMLTMMNTKTFAGWMSSGDMPVLTMRESLLSIDENYENHWKLSEQLAHYQAS